MNFESFKKGAQVFGGVVGAVAATYFTTIYLPAKIIGAATAATTAAMNSTLGSAATWFSGTIADTAAIAGAEAYGAAKATGLVGVSPVAILGAASIGYTLGSKAVQYTLIGIEKAYDGFSKVSSSWKDKVSSNNEQIGAGIICSAM